MTSGPKVVSVPQAALMLGIGRGLAYELCRTGELPHLRLGRRLVIPIAALDRMLAEANKWQGADQRINAENLRRNSL